MKRLLAILVVALLVLPLIAAAQQRTIEGKGEEYHHAMYLNFKHAAEEAEALNFQVTLPHELIREIAMQHVDEIWKSLEAARVQHAMIHKTYGEQQSMLVAENHLALLDAHNRALEASKILNKEMMKANPDLKVLRDQAAEVYKQAFKAATEHLDGMKKLGIPIIKAAS